jgi:hypothetical protein
MLELIAAAKDNDHLIALHENYLGSLAVLSYPRA